MAGLRDLHKYPTLPLLFVLFACVLYIMFDLTAYHPSLTPLGIYNKYMCDVNETKLTPAIDNLTLEEVPEVTTTKHDITAEDLQFISKKDFSRDIRGIMKHAYKDEMIRYDPVDAFVDIAEKLNITYFMTCGTLIGSYRHHKMAPWD